MLIKKIKYKEHPILGDLELDLINSNTGKPYKTIIFAGENGTGKTTILETLSTFLNRGTFEYFEYIDYLADENNLQALPWDHPTIKYFYNMKDDSGDITEMNTGKGKNGGSTGNEVIDNNPMNIRYNGCVLSKARADYKTKKITSSTTKDIDKDKYDLDGEDDFTSLKQLLVDIKGQDDSLYADINRRKSITGDTPLDWEGFLPQSKTYRFQGAFDSFFEEIVFDGVDNIDDEKSVLFMKNGNSISIDQLSTGEKQIVFRGAYLLKNSGILEGGTIMIDEPELSMHPKWEQKILNYYKNLFNKNGIQTTQMFIATHSDHVLKEALQNKEENLVIILKEKNYSPGIELIKIDSPNTLPTITSAETNYLAFDIVSSDYHIELYGWLQEKEGFEESLGGCDSFIKNHPKYNSSQHLKRSTHTFKNGNSRTFETLPTYVRNAIHHPSTTGNFTEKELRTSIELLIELCR